MDEGLNREPEADYEEFVQHLTKEQTYLLNYITALLCGDVLAAENVLQETNLVLWRKATEFTSGTSFRAWSRKVAHWQIMAYLRDIRRDRHVFSEELIAQISNRDAEFATDPETRGALRDCIKKLHQTQSELVKLRYEESLPIGTIAERAGRSEDAIRSALLRIRRSLLSCIESKLSPE
ncbi:sigma-70 family RNA polymerase sigma factor [Aeoliella mucimassa]|uniref:ECF RNA polymerase sigma factor SigK n=1 Tax=Aeoliella mucimassa TaxID=2527972 RepID=A0A518AR92_9BACT|nr:sigma-70 family RNA polymerase sigma factor [Aeoliella mucimassa]QDU57241.1 ECF RNA polymerase sigma factor SigK [Aeoliella mucimassa]